MWWRPGAPLGRAGGEELGSGQEEDGGERDRPGADGGRGGRAALEVDGARDEAGQPRLGADGDVGDAQARLPGRGARRQEVAVEAGGDVGGDAAAEVDGEADRLAGRVLERERDGAVADADQDGAARGNGPQRARERFALLGLHRGDRADQQGEDGRRPGTDHAGWTSMSRTISRSSPSSTSLAFPLGDDGGRERVADHVGGRAAHVEEGVNAEDQQQAFFRQAELAEGRGDDDQRGAGDAGDALAGEHEGEQHRDLRPEGERGCRRPGR